MTTDKKTDFDHVTFFGREMAKARAEQLRLDELNHGQVSDVAALYYRSAELHASDREYAMRDAIALYPAQNLEGALMQMAVLRIFVDELADMDDKETDSYHGKQVARKIHRLEASIADQIEKHCSTDLDKLGMGELADRVRNPFVLVDDRIANLTAQSTQKRAA